MTFKRGDLVYSHDFEDLVCQRLACEESHKCCKTFFEVVEIMSSGTIHVVDVLIKEHHPIFVNASHLQLLK